MDLDGDLSHSINHQKVLEWWNINTFLHWSNIKVYLSNTACTQSGDKAVLSNLGRGGAMAFYGMEDFMPTTISQNNDYINHNPVIDRNPKHIWHNTTIRHR
ncbi:piriformospora indica-insensitive protein [Trifolium repens]|nr:piriformospora indica-insensitive protein [Trifolium repens]